MSSSPSKSTCRPSENVSANDRTVLPRRRTTIELTVPRSRSEVPILEVHANLPLPIVNNVLDNSLMRRFAACQLINTTTPPQTTPIVKVMRKCMGCDLLGSRPNIVANGTMRNNGRIAPRRIRLASASPNLNDLVSSIIPLKTGRLSEAPGDTGPRLRCLRLPIFRGGVRYQRAQQVFAGVSDNANSMVERRLVYLGGLCKST